ncbi:unnamed protein product, partial [Rotaria sp. Silwood1]
MSFDVALVKIRQLDLKKEEEDGTRSHLDYDFPAQRSTMLPPRTLMLYFEQGRPMPIDEQRLNFVKFVRVKKD